MFTISSHSITTLPSVAESMEQLSKECFEDATKAASFDLKTYTFLGKGWCKFFYITPPVLETKYFFKMLLKSVCII